MTHWAARWVGTPWIAGESDCWSLARRVWAVEFGREVPPIPAGLDPRDPRVAVRAFAAGASSGDWITADPGRDGDAVLMARGARPCHIGLWVAAEPPEAPRVLHALEGAGAVCTPAGRLDELGYRILSLLRRRDWA